MNFQSVLEKCRRNAANSAELGTTFEILSQRYLQTDPKYASDLSNVWLWKEFPYRNEFGGRDIGIDIVAQTKRGEYWAVQCKCYDENTTINKSDVDSFLSTSARSFTGAGGEKKKFVARYWISTSYNWGPNASETLKNQEPPVIIVNPMELDDSPVDWEKLYGGEYGAKARTAKKSLRKHQIDALNAAHEYYRHAERGKLIMACGTGKTFTSLKIAERETDSNGFILFLVPSIGLLNQTLNEWYAESEKTLNAVCVCSDRNANAKRKDSDIAIDTLAKPASTDVTELALQYDFIRKHKTEGMTVIFSTYQSIDVVAELQAKIEEEYGEDAIFDMIICDEAHRTTGILESNSKESTCFTKVNKKEFIKAKKRMYMTATPRVYSPEVRKKAEDNDFILSSMDDVSIYGEEFYNISFGEAVRDGLLSDYKVFVLTLTEEQLGTDWQSALTIDKEIAAADSTKIAGCVSALSKHMAMFGELYKEADLVCSTDPLPMHKAVAFAPTIADSDNVVKPIFNALPEHYEEIWGDESKKLIKVAAQHIDGTMSALKRDEKLAWLKDAGTSENDECRILTNVRCLSEGIDVPSLDAVIFLAPKNSPVEVIQSVGRVMRKAEGKKYGYIIIPVVIPSGVEPEDALDDNKTMRVVWEIIQALRAHDERLVTRIEKFKLNNRKPSKDDSIVIVKPVTENDSEEKQEDKASGKTDEKKFGEKFTQQTLLELEEDYVQALFARLVKRVGRKKYWEQWAAEIQQIAQSHVEKITEIVKKDSNAKAEFQKFIDGLHANINPYITEEDAKDMLAQHFITKPVFEALFGNYAFVKNNSVSIAMQGIFDVLDKKNLTGEWSGETRKLEKFYKDVRENYEEITTDEAKQRVIKDLYEKFFKTAMKKTVDKLGIVYTPIEIVDFIINSVSDILKKEFDRDISDENVHILDPFTGTGTFITRLLQSGKIKDADLPRKYAKELHANEIVLLAYYIASINIENVFHSRTGSACYQNFEGICLTDTFQLYEEKSGGKLSGFFPKNIKRLEDQQKAPITVIIGNPPYSVGQKSANDNAQNQSYENLDKAVADSYVAHGTATNKNALYDTYIKAFRWASDRLGKNGGVIGFVTNSSWLDSNSTDGFRYCLEQEFSSIYVFNLRGNARTQGEQRRKESGNVFGEGSRTPVAITILVKNPNAANKKAEIHYHDIGDYLSREEKLKIVKDFATVTNPNFKTETITPDEHNDWLNLRDNSFENFIPLCSEKKFDEAAKSVFNTYSCGVKTQRDIWMYNFSLPKLKEKFTESVNFYNEQRIGYHKAKAEEAGLKADDFINFDAKNISWSDGVKSNLTRNLPCSVNAECFTHAIYRPFCKMNFAYEKFMIERTYRQLSFYPTGKEDNLVICVTGLGSSKDFSITLTNIIPDIQTVFNGQCFPLYWYEPKEKAKQTSLFDEAGEDGGKYTRHDGITDFAVEEARKLYSDYKITKKDVFYYVYGLLHSPQYREKFAANLKKELPRIPFVDSADDFKAFSKAGKALADLHLNYETQPKLPEVVVSGEDSGKFRVSKMKYASKEDKSAIIYNDWITVSGIPEIANEYVVNGRTPMEWIIDRYQIKTDKDSGIRNDPNDWAEEHSQPRYILDLLLSVITVSVKTMEIVKALPKLDFSGTE